MLLIPAELSNARSGSPSKLGTEQNVNIELRQVAAAAIRLWESESST